MQEPIFIASPPRSGSSLTGLLLHSFGLWSGDTKEANEFNPKGFYENLEISQILIDYLRANDKDNLGKRFQPLMLNHTDISVRQKILDVVKSQGLGDDQPWFYKDPKIAICRDLLLDAFPNAKWIWVNRSQDRTIRSLMRTDFMDAYDNEEDWKKFLAVYKFYKQDLKTKTNVFELDIDKIMDKDQSEVDRLSDYLGIEADFTLSKLLI